MSGSDFRAAIQIFRSGSSFQESSMSKHARAGARVSQKAALFGVRQASRPASSCQAARSASQPAIGPGRITCWLASPLTVRVSLTTSSRRSRSGP